MKRLLCLLVLTTVSLFSLPATAQKIAYSDPDRDDVRSVNFEIIGKFGNQFLLYKNNRDNHYIALYDNDMKMVEKKKLEFMPDRVVNVDFIYYPDHFYMIYQYQRRSVMHLAGVKMDGEGNAVGEPQVLDTTDINFFPNNRLYSVLNSENKEYITAIKINSKNDRAHVVTSLLFNKGLQLVRKTPVTVPMPERNDFLTEFAVDNEGELVFLRAAGTNQNDNINKLTLFRQNASGAVGSHEIEVKDIYLDDVKVKVNNASRQYLLSSFYSKERRGNIHGLFNVLYDKGSAGVVVNSQTVFSDDFRSDARGESGVRNAFDDFFLQNIIMRKDGGFIVSAEAVYTSTRGGTMSRWDYLYGSPFWTPSDYYLFRNYGYFSPWWRGGFSSPVTRYYADNIAVMSFDKTGKMEWSNVIRKSQYDDNSDNFIGYGSIITGGEIHFLFNQLERRTLLLTDHSVTADGSLKRNPTFRNLDKGYDFMPRYSKQVSARQVIIPCQYRNYICFAKVEF